MTFIRGTRRAQELKQLDGIFALYDTRSRAAVQEQAARGQIGMSGLPVFVASESVENIHKSASDLDASIHGSNLFQGQKARAHRKTSLTTRQASACSVSTNVLTYFEKRGSYA
jgi:hypothetical protein